MLSDLLYLCMLMESSGLPVRNDGITSHCLHLPFSTLTTLGLHLPKYQHCNPFLSLLFSSGPRLAPGADTNPVQATILSGASASAYHELVSKQILSPASDPRVTISGERGSGL